MARVRSVLLLICLLSAGCGDNDGSVFSSQPTALGSDTSAVTVEPHGDGVLDPDVLPPDPSTIIDTAAFGQVYDRRILIRLASAATLDAADEAAAAVGGTVVSRIDEFLIAEIELTASGEVALASALEALAAHPAVAIAAPSGVVSPAWGVSEAPCGPLDSLVLQAEDRGDQYSLIGVEDAWRLVRASGATTTKPIVGVIDGFTATINYHGSWVGQVVDTTDDPGNPPGVLDAVLGNGAAVVSRWEVFGSSQHTSDSAWMAAARNAVVQDHATVVNLSLGGEDTPSGQAIVRQFLQDMAVQHPHVLFVAAAGNNAGDVATFGPGGLNEPNLVTVGGLNHQGERWYETWTDANGAQQVSGSNYVGTGGEVTLSAIAQDVFTGFDTNGEPVVKSGTSFATPQVTATVALLQALDPTLTGAQIKQILVDSAATEIANPDINERITAVDPALGGRVLRVDNAVYKVLSERLGVTGTQQEILGRATLEARGRPADNEPLTYMIRATAPDGGDTTTVQISVNGPGSLVPSTESLITDDAVARWRWSFFEPGQTVQATLTRTDTGACARLVITAEETPGFPYAGTYEGSLIWLHNTQTWDDYYLPFTLVIDREGVVTGDGEAEECFTFDDATGCTQMTARFTGSVDEAGNLALTVQVHQCITAEDQSGCADESLPVAWTIDQNGSLSGVIEWPDGSGAVEGTAVSGGPAGLP